MNNPLYNFHIEFYPGKRSKLFTYLKENPVYAKVLYILKLYTLCKTSIGSNINDLNTISYNNKNNTRDIDHSDAEQVRRGIKNLKTLLKILFESDTPSKIRQNGENHKFTDNNSISSYYTGGSGNGYLFDELYTLFLLNLPLSGYDILFLQFIWNSRIYPDQLTILYATDAPLLTSLDMYIKQWTMRTISIQTTRIYQSDPNYLPLPPVYYLGRLNLLHCNKHTSFTQHVKLSVLSLFQTHIDKNNTKSDSRVTPKNLIQTGSNSSKSHIDQINTLFNALRANITDNLPIYVALFKNAIYQVNLHTLPIYKSLLKKHKDDSILSLIRQLPELRAAIFPQLSSDETIDAKNIEESLKYIYPFILNYPSNFKHTKESQCEFIYVACIALYISCNYINSPSSKSPTLHFKQKDISAIEDKNLTKIKSIFDLLSKNKGKNCYKLLYPLSSSYNNKDLIPISDNLGLVNILDIPSLSCKPEQIKKKATKGTDITLIKSVTIFYLILFISKLYSPSPKDFFDFIKNQYELTNLYTTQSAFIDIYDILNIYRIKEVK